MSNVCEHGRLARSCDSCALTVAEARVVELEAIVAKLPKTADGVPVVPGMDLWRLTTIGPSLENVIEYYKHSDGRLNAAVFSASDYEYHCPVEYCYSTESAALAAAKQK